MFDESPIVTIEHFAPSAEDGPPQPDRAEIERALETVWAKYDRVELRVIHPEDHRGKTQIDGGMFDADHLPQFVDAAIRSNAKGAVYVTLNPIGSSYQPSSVNALKPYAKGLVKDHDIDRRCWLPIDLDPVRPSNTSATDEQLAAAIKLCEEVKRHLTGQGWPDPVVAASGNGMHLLYRIDLPNDTPSLLLVRSVLKRLHERLSNTSVKVDTGLSNAGRIIKLYGTVANKGLHTAETPHRLSRLIHVPDNLGTVTALQLQALTGNQEGVIQGTPLHRSVGSINDLLTASTFDLNGFLAKLGIPYEEEVKEDGANWYHLQHCPFNPEHGFKKSAVSKRVDGTLGFKCFHDSCSDHNWHALRRLVDGEPPTVSAEGVQAAVGQTVFKPPQKLPPELKPVLRMNPATLPERMRDGLVDIAERLGCPLDFVAIPALIAAGAVIGNRVGILPKQFDESWVVHPGLWGGVIAPPGSMKSPALNLAIKPLAHLEQQAALAYSTAMRKYKADKATYDKAVADFKQGRTTSFPVEPVEPAKTRYIVNDVTYQALGEILVNNPQGVLAVGDELSGLLQTLDAPGQEAARGFFLSGWGGTSSYTFDRISRGTLVLNRYMLSLFGGFQPDRIKQYVQGAQGGSTSNDGLLQRFQLLVWPDLPPYAGQVDRVPNKAAVQAFEMAIIQLDMNRPGFQGGWLV